MKRSEFKIAQMDCPSEENLIRMKLDGIENIKHLDFDIPNRKLTVFHTESVASIETAIGELKLGATHLSTETTTINKFEKDNNQKKLLWTVLIINFIFFGVEMTTGLISKSMGLVADSLDMLADAFVYGISLYAVGGTILRKKKIAKIAGYFQIGLAAFGFMEVLRRFLGSEQMPDFMIMIIISFFALIANGVCLYLLQQSKSKEEAHMKASSIFTSNDIVINLGVIGAAVLVKIFNSAIPDLIIGIVVFVIVIKGAIRILKLSK